MLRRFRKLSILATMALLATTVTTVVFTSSAEAADPISYTFRFVNGQTISGQANDKDHFLPNAGGTSATNPTGMTVHLSCSDKFTGGWGDKEGPVQGVDTAWQIDSYFIQKGNKTCGTPTPPEPPPDPPAIDIEKFVNGQDADDPTGPQINIGDTATFSYEVTNTGGVPLRNVQVTDSTLGPISCPKSELAVDESMSCSDQTETITKAGQFTMKATVTAIGDVMTPGLPPNIPEKGEAVRFTFVNGTTVVRVTDKKDEFFPNVGGSSVENPTGIKIHLSCSDKFIGGWGQKDGPTQGVDTAWQIASFSIGKIKKGQFELKCGDPFSIPEPKEVMDMDPVYYFVPPPADPKIDIEKFVNGHDADSPPGPTLEEGSTATFTYVVTNTGDVPLTGILVTDNVAGAIACPRTELGVDESMECDATTMTAEVGQQSMEACVKGFHDGREVNDCDPVYYYVPPPKPPIECVVVKTDHGPKISWTDVGAESYEVWRNSKSIGSTNGLMLTDFDAPTGKTLFYRVVAMLPDWKVMVADCGKIKIPPPPKDCPVQLKFFNHTDGKVEVRWIGSDGAETTLGRPGPGETFHWEEFRSQPWRVYDRHGKLLLHFTPDKCGENFVLIVPRH